MLALAGAKQRALLAILLLRANQVVSSDQLIDELWGDQSPRSGRTALQVLVSQLRKALGESGDCARHPAPGLCPPSRPRRARRAQVRAVDRRRRSCRPGGRRPPGCGTRSRCGGDRRSPISPTRRSLSRRSGASRSFVWLRSSGGSTRTSHSAGHAELVAELQTLTAEHPLRERLYAQLDARAVPMRSAGRRAGRLPDVAACARRAARDRTERAVAGARAGDPPAGPVSRADDRGLVGAFGARPRTGGRRRSARSSTSPPRSRAARAESW